MTVVVALILSLLTSPNPQHDSFPAPKFVKRTVWDDLADCESGDWVNGGEYFVEDSARWDMQPHTLHSYIFEGGLQFHPQTWDAYKPDNYPEAAWQASRGQQIIVAERVLEDQGWGAWPVCSRMIGLR